MSSRKTLFASTIVLGAAATLLAAGTHATPISPVAVLKGDAAKAANNASILYRNVESGATVVRAKDAGKSDFQDIYLVNTHNFFALPDEFKTYGETLVFEPGHFAVMRLNPDRVAALSHLMHHAGLACGVLMKLDGDAETPPEKMAGTPTPVLPVAVRDVRVEAAVAKVSADNIRSTIEFMVGMGTRRHDSSQGALVANALGDKYRALAVGRDDVTISAYDHGSETPQDSLVVRIEGTSRDSEVIVLGSHLDSIAWFGGTAPGADDNASGTATNLEIFRVLMAEGVRPARTIEIHAYAAEEVGLVGSADMASRYKEAGINVVAMLQHDMTLWKAAGTEDKIWFVTNNTDSGFNDLLATLTDGYVGMSWGRASLSGGSSDHASWRREGFATAFPFENPTSYNRNIHTAGDTIANSNAFTQAAGFAKLGLAYALHFGGIE